MIKSDFIRQSFYDHTLLLEKKIADIIGIIDFTSILEKNETINRNISKHVYFSVFFFAYSQT